MNASGITNTPVFLVDDHPMIRHGLTLVLEQAGFTICGEADAPQSTLAHPGLAAARVVILDLSLDQADGIDFIPALCERCLFVIVYSMHEEAAIIRRAFAAGAKGYITKREAALSLATAIETVLNGQTFISQRAAAAIANSPNDPELSEQQQEVYDLLGQGYDTDEIARRLTISPRTVETYCTRLMNKLTVEGMKELRRRAIADRQRRRR